MARWPPGGPKMAQRYPQDANLQGPAASQPESQANSGLVEPSRAGVLILASLSLPGAFPGRGPFCKICVSGELGNRNFKRIRAPKTRPFWICLFACISDELPFLVQERICRARHLLNSNPHQILASLSPPRAGVLRGEGVGLAPRGSQEAPRNRSIPFRFVS